MSFLQKILQSKQAEIELAKKNRPMELLRTEESRAASPRPFAGVLRSDSISVIAEIKKSSPSRGILSNDFDHRRLAREYEQGGASALSVLTDEPFFMGRPEFISDVKGVCSLPVLRKDFIVDEYQVFESRVLGADAILLIVSILKKDSLKNLYACARSLGLEVLVETHSAAEIDVANGIGADIIGINNRDLETFEVSPDLSVRLRERIRPAAVSVSESGIKTAKDVEALRNAGFDAILIGEGLMVRKDKTSALRELVGK